jgi:glycosyltransferase involved in cell wall biosynthesis
LAKGEYLIFLDSDDIFNPQLLEQLNAKSYKNFDFICWEVKKITEKKTEIIKPKFLGPLFNNTTAIFLAGSFCLKRDLFWKVGGYDTEITFGENYELGIRISQLNNLKIRLIQETFIQYNLDSFERTSNSIQNRLFSLFRQYKKHKEIYISYTKLNAKAFYFFGYLLEKSFKYNYAEKLYMASWRLTPWNMKYLLKYFLLKLKKR